MAGRTSYGDRPGGDATRLGTRETQVMDHLGTLETQVMDHLWMHGVTTVAQLMAALPGAPAYTTIATVLNNLRKKRLVARRKDGHASLYEARISREEYTARVVDRVFDASGDREAAMLHFMNRMGHDDLELLREFLRERSETGE